MTSMTSVGAAGSAFSPTTISGSRSNASQLIQDFTNPSTKILDTRGLAERMAELSDGDPEAAGAILREVESELKLHETSQLTLADLRGDFEAAVAPLGEGANGLPAEAAKNTPPSVTPGTASTTSELTNEHASSMTAKQETLDQLLEKHPELAERLQNDPHFQLLALEAENASRKVHLGAASLVAASYSKASTKINETLLALGGGPAGSSALAVSGNKLLGDSVSTLLEEAKASPKDLALMGTDLIREGLKEREAAGDRLLQYAQSQAAQPSPAELDEARAARATFASELLDLESMAIGPGDLLKFAEDTANAAGGVEKVIDEDYSDFAFDISDQYFRNGNLNRDSYFAETTAGSTVWGQEGGNWKLLANEASRSRDNIEEFVRNTPALALVVADSKQAINDAAVGNMSPESLDEISQRVSGLNDTLRELLAPVQDDLQQLQKIKALYDQYY